MIRCRAWEALCNWLRSPAPDYEADRESQEAMRSGPRSYTPNQGEVIDLAVRSRRPLPESPLPIDD